MKQLHHTNQISIPALICAAATCLIATRANAAIIDLGAFGGHQYYYDTLQYPTYLAADAAAQTLVNGQVVSITSAAEESFLINAIAPFAASTAGLAYIGLTRPDNGVPFSWSGGEPLGYTNWRPGGVGESFAEPTNGAFGGNETNVVMYIDFGGSLGPIPLGQWADVYATAPGPTNAIYETPEPCVISILVVGTAILLPGRRRNRA